YEDDQLNPAIDGDIIVWTDCRKEIYEDNDIYGYNLSSGIEFPVCADSYCQSSPAISGNIVVWKENCNNYWYATDIYGCNLSDGIKFPICLNPSGQELPAVSNNIVVWTDSRNGNDDIYGARLTFEE
ncbi:MAG: cell surface protein, partial [Dehalococcoidia bacterium]